MTRFLLTTAAVVLSAAGASAQYQSQPYPAPYSPPGAAPAVMPNIYNPRTQPLSPYLNMLRGGNPAANYYYGVRPGTLGGASGGTIGAPFTAGGGNRTLFFPQLATAPDPFQIDQPGPGDVLPPAGHPVVFNNTMGYFPSPFGGRGSGNRPGLAGVGTTRPPAPRK